METIKQTFTFNHVIADLKHEIKQLKRDLKIVQNSFDNDLDFESGNHFSLNVKNDKIQSLSDKISKKERELNQLILALSN